MQVGRTKDQGLYNKLSAAMHPQALAARTLPQYTTIVRGICVAARQGGVSQSFKKNEINACTVSQH